MQIRENISLRPYNSFGIDVSAKNFASFNSVDDLQYLPVQYTNDRKDLLVLGGGSNVLFTRNFDGLVLHNCTRGISINFDGTNVLVTAGAGENWHGLVMFCVGNGYAGMENLALIPGSVGASPMQNIGAYGVEVKDIFESLTAWHIEEKILYTFTNQQCGFGYRESVFKKEHKGQFIITSVTFKLCTQPRFNISYGAIQAELEMMAVQQLSIAAIAQAVINIRGSKLPDWRMLGNAGSFFKNPVIENEKFEGIKESHPSVSSFPAGPQHTKLAAGWLIEQCGWKGFRRGDAGCYDKQALVLVNYGKATGKEIFDLSSEIIRSVHDKFGVELEREVNIL